MKPRTNSFTPGRLVVVGALLTSTFLGAALDRWLFPVARQTPQGSPLASPFSLTRERTPSLSTERLTALTRFADRDNTAAIWTSLAGELAGKHLQDIRTSLADALKRPLSNEREPWKDPGRPRTEAHVELLLVRGAPEMATDLLVEAPERIARALLMRALRAHYQKDPDTARALASSLIPDIWSNLTWLEREDDPRTSPPPPPPAPPPGSEGEEGERSWAWTLPDPLSETEACLAALDALPPLERKRIIGGMYRSPGGAGSPISSFWESYPEIAARFVERLPPGDNARGNVVREVASAWAQSDPKKALAWLESLEDFSGTEWSYGAVMKAYAEKDPRAATAWVATRGSDQLSQHTAHAVAEQWASEDPRAALAWAQTVDEPEVRKSAIQAGLNQWATDDAPSALAFALEQPSDTEREQSLRAVFQSYGQTDFDGAWQAVQSLTGEDYAIALQGMLWQAIPTGRFEDLSHLTEAIQAYAATDPAKISSFAFDPFINQYARAMTRQDALAAVEWALDLPMGEARNSSINGVFYGWAFEDPYSAAEALATLPPGPDRDAAITAAFTGLSRRNPERAFHWALSAESSDTQWELAQKTLRSWESDWDTLRGAVEQAPAMLPDMKERLLQAIAEKSRPAK